MKSEIILTNILEYLNILSEYYDKVILYKNSLEYSIIYKKNKEEVKFYEELHFERLRDLISKYKEFFYYIKIVSNDRVSLENKEEFLDFTFSLIKETSYTENFKIELKYYISIKINQIIYFLDELGT